MIKIKEVIVVEGRYDKSKLSSIVDALIIKTDGFGIFKDKEKLSLLKSLAKTRGLLILTDSDAAGFKIRNFLKSRIGDSNIKHAYIPDIFGKEKRKESYSKEGKLGVEGIPSDILTQALESAGISVSDERPEKDRVTKYHLYRDGFCGGPQSATKRRELMKHMGLPTRLSTNAFIEVLSITVDYDEYLEIVNKLNE